MIVIKNIDYFETEKDIHQLIETIYDPKYHDYNSMPINDKVVSKDFIHSLINGKRFISTRYNIDVYIGLSSYVNQVLSMPFQIIEKLENELEVEKRSAERDKQEFLDIQCKISGASFWQRLKYLFTRIL